MEFFRENKSFTIDECRDLRFLQILFAITAKAKTPAKPVLIAASNVITAALVVGGSAKIRSLPQAANTPKTDVQNLYRQRVILF